MRRPAARHATLRLALYCLLLILALCFLLPLWAMIVTSLKTMTEIRHSAILAWPVAPTFAPWREAWAHACTGLTCRGVEPGFANSLSILVPSVSLSILLGSVTGYALALWRPKGMSLLSAMLTFGAFMPVQLFIYPLVAGFSVLHVHGTIAAVVIVHVLFSLPVTTMIFRGYFQTIPLDILNAARMDGAGFLPIFGSIILPMSGPALGVAAIMQTTTVWNDFLFGLVFASPSGQPMTVQLNNIINTTFGEKAYNVDMAATMLTALPPLLVYLLAGKWFVRGITAGATKG